MDRQTDRQAKEIDTQTERQTDGQRKRLREWQRGGGGGRTREQERCTHLVLINLRVDEGKTATCE